MILERAIFAIKPGQADDFEKAFALAAPLIRAAKGNRKAEMHRGIENPDSFILLCEWDSAGGPYGRLPRKPGLHRMARHPGAALRPPPAMEHYTAPL